MNFLAPLAFLAAIVLPVIVLMYLLKLRRRRVVVPSTLLWRRSVQDLVANAPFQKLRNNLLLYLQLLIVAALIFGLARPTLKLQDLRGETLILLLDVSASMQALEPDGRPRIEHAREAAMRLVESLSPNDRAIIATFSNKTQVVQTITANKESLRQALRSLAPSDTDTNLREAAFILSDLVTTVNDKNERVARTDTRTVLISDGALGSGGAQLLVDIPNLEYIRVGSRHENAGITALDIRQSFSGAFEYEIFASVFNCGTDPVDRFVELSVNGEVLDLKRLSIPPGKTIPVVFTTGERLSGVAQVALQEKDDFAVDNVARGILSMREKTRVLLVSSGNYFLQQVFNVDPNVEVSRIAPADYHPGGEYDLTVFENCSFENLPAANYLFINGAPKDIGFTIAPEPLERPPILDWNRVHPLTRFVNLEKIILRKSLRIEPPSAATILAESEQAPMLVLYERDLMRVLVIPFNLLESDWPLQASFPIFIANVLDYFSRAQRTTAKAAYRTGEIVSISSDRKSNSVRVRRPDEQEAVFPLDQSSTVHFTQTDRAGVYDLKYEPDGRSEYFTTSLLSPEESDITPAETLDLGGRKVEGQTEIVRVNREVWPWFLLGALGILCLEWWIYCRRAWA